MYMHWLTENKEGRYDKRKERFEEQTTNPQATRFPDGAYEQAMIQVVGILIACSWFGEEKQNEREKVRQEGEMEDEQKKEETFFGLKDLINNLRHQTV